MQDLYQKFSDYLKGLSLREKLLMLFVGIAVIYAIWDFVFFSAYIKQQQLNQSKVSEVQSEAADIDTKVAEVTSQLVAQGNPNQTLKQDIETIKQEIEVVEEQLTETFNSLVPPKEVTNFIRSLILKNDNIELISLSNEPVEIIEITEGDQIEADADKQKSSARLYKHATNIKLKTSYTALYDYLNQLEQSEWALYWDQLEYKVDSYPQAEVSLRVYTLSTDEHWLGL